MLQDSLIMINFAGLLLPNSQKQLIHVAASLANHANISG